MGMLEQKEVPYSDKSFLELAVILAHMFVEVHEKAQSNSVLNGMPRRLQLSSMMTQLLFQNTSLCMAIFEKFFEDPNIKSFLGFDREKTALDNALASNQVCVVDNSGSGGTQQPVSIVVNIVLAAIDLTVLERGKFDLDAIDANMPKAFEKFKAFSKGEEINEEHLIGFSGFETDGNVSMGFGSLNATSLNDFQAVYFFGNRARLGFVVRENFVRKKLFAGAPEEMQEYFNKNADNIDLGFFNRMNTTVRNIRLALVLTLSGLDKLFPVFVESDYLISPTGNMNSFIWHDDHVPYKNAPMKLSQKFANKISIKYLKIVDADLANISIAVNRLLSAVCSKDDQDDALIDAVVCWEI